MTKERTIGELKASGYVSRSIKMELRENLIQKLKKKESIFEGIRGYDTTVLPQVERAILSGHSINFLGLRGQAKTRMARQMVGLMDEYIPIIAGSEVNDDPLMPVSPFGRKMVEEKGDDCTIEWVHRNNRYSEKLATPDVNIADMIGDVDPIKAANLRLSYADEGVIHFGMIPRANRGIFVINELPDLQARIQVALFNILQEGDLQIRGFKLRFPIDIQFVFTANPEDYTNRGSIITPLKDRIQSQIFTHYPKSIRISKEITQQEVSLTNSQKESIRIPELIQDLIEQIAVEARESEYVDEKSGVSARLTITAYESVVSAVERRMIINGESSGTARIADLMSSIPAIVGKIEMVYEGEQEGAVNVAHRLISKSIRALARHHFEDIEMLGNKNRPDVRERYMSAAHWFEKGNDLNIIADASDEEYQEALRAVKGLDKAIEEFTRDVQTGDRMVMQEYLIHCMAEYSLLDKKLIGVDYRFMDYFSSVMPGMN